MSNEEFLVLHQELREYAELESICKQLMEDEETINDFLKQEE